VKALVVALVLAGVCGTTLTDRNWQQWRVRRADGDWFGVDPLLRPEAVVPVGVPHDVLPCGEEWVRTRVAVAGVPVELTVGPREAEVVVEGRLPEATAGQVIEEVRARMEVALGRTCDIERV
jgi:hypothetical protein